MNKHAILLAGILLSFLSALSYAQAPVPFINLPLVPDATAPGGPGFTLTVNGTGFVSNSVVNWNGTALVTQFVNQSQLTTTVPAADIATANTGWVTVVNPAPGGGTSNTAFCTVTSNLGNSVAFTLASSPPAGNFPNGLAVGDFNGDGKLDLAVADLIGNTVSILLGDGRGNFTLVSSPTVGAYPESVAVGDFNGDGKLDLAVADFLGNTVSILLGDGTGNFTLASSPATGVGPFSVAVGDFNGDGKLDLAAANVDNTVSILLGDGTGNFTLTSSLPYGGYGIATGDFNGDGKLDLAVADSTAGGGGVVSVLLGDGTGNFTLVSSSYTSCCPNSVVAGDFNGDGKLDLAVAQFAGGIFILLGDGTGNFTLASNPGADYGLISIAAGDLNGDGNLDLALSNHYDTTVSVLLGDGAGNFTACCALPIGSYPEGVTVGDFNGDGKVDLAVATGGVAIALQAVPQVLLSPTSLTFDTQLVGTRSDPQTVTLTNTGSSTLNITSIAASANFVQKNGCGASLGTGKRCRITVAFKPYGVGTLTGMVTITDNASNSPQTVSLTGVGTTVTLLPSSVDFGDQPVGTTSPPQTVTFTNYANRALSIQGIRIAGGGTKSFAQTNNCGTSVPAGGNCTISVTFTPTHKYWNSATLQVYDNGGASPQTVALSGNGT